MKNKPRIIYPLSHPRSARKRMERRDRIEALIFGGLVLLIMAIILQFSLHAI